MYNCNNSMKFMVCVYIYIYIFVPVHGILQARILEGIAIPFSKRPSQPRTETRSPALQVDSLPSEPPVKPIY